MTARVVRIEISRETDRGTVWYRARVDGYPDVWRRTSMSDAICVAQVQVLERAQQRARTHLSPEPLVFEFDDAKEVMSHAVLPVG